LVYEQEPFSNNISTCDTDLNEYIKLFNSFRVTDVYIRCFQVLGWLSQVKLRQVRLLG
jgi:hypothetical protein